MLDTNAEVKSSTASRRDIILKEATNLFCHGGYSGTRMTDIANAIGVTKPVVYRYFKSKEDLFEAWLEHELIAARDQLVELIRDEAIPVKEKTNRLVLALVESLKSPILMAPWRIALVESERFPDITSLLCSRFKDPVLHEVGLMFDKASANGEVKGASAEHLTRLFLAPLSSSAVLIAIFSEKAFEGFSFAEMLQCHLVGFWRAWGA